MRLLLPLLFLTTCLFGQSAEQGRKFYQEKKYPEAQKALLAIAENSKDYADARYYLGRIAFDQNELEKAEEFFEEAIETNDKVADYHYWYGSAMGRIAQQSNTFKQGLLAPKIKEAFEKTVVLDPKNLDAHWGLIEFYTQAPGFMGGSWEKAEATAKAIMKITKAEGHRALGVVYQRQEKLVEAETQFVHAYTADPQYMYNLANFYIGQKKFDKAFKLFNDALAKTPDNMMIIYQLGKLSAVSGQELDKGEAHLTQYLGYKPKENEPSLAGANMRLAQIKEKKGQKAEAKKLFEKALQLDANLKEAKEGLHRLSKG